MANETTYARVEHLLPVIKELTLDYMRTSFVMPQTVKVFADTTSWVDREVDAYFDDSLDVMDNLGETEDLAATEIIRELKNRLTPKEIGKQYILTDRRNESEAGMVARAVRGLGYTMGRKLERDLFGVLPSLQGGSYGDATNRMSLDLLYWARSAMEGAGLAGPFYTVLHPWQYRDIHKELTDLSQPAVLSIREQASRQYQIVQVADFTIILSNNVPRIKTVGSTYSVDLGGATGGTYNLVVNGQVTADIAFDAVEAAIVAALNALSNVTAGDIVVDTDAPADDADLTMAVNLINEEPVINIITKNLTGYDTFPRVYITSHGTGYFAGGMWLRDAMAFDLRRGMRIEPQRDASLRSTELNGTMGYAVGLWEGEKGVVIGSEASLADPSFPA